MKKLLPLALAVSLTSLQPIFAQVVTWNGNTGGDWSLDSNWIGGVKPGATDEAVLPSVTDASTRIVTQDTAAGETISSLRFEQDGATGVNRLDLSGNISFTKASREGATSAYLVDLTNAATKDQVVLNLNGHAILFTGGNPSGATGGGTIDGTVNFNATGSAILRTSVSGHNIFNIPGIMIVTADGRFGRDTGGTSNTGNFTVNYQTGSELNISNNSTFSIEVADRRAQNRNYTLNNSGQIDLAGGSTLELAVNSTNGGSTNSMNVTFNNTANGTMLHSGAVALKPHKNASELTVFSSINQDGIWTVAGENASIRRLTTAQDGSFIAIPEFLLRDGGVLTGSGASDGMEFNEEVFTNSRMTITNDGLITPGDGTSGAGLASVGMLTFRDINLTSGATGGIVNMDFGGVGAGEYDQIILATGLTDPAGAGTLDLSASGDTLNLFSVNGFTPSSGFTVSLFQAGSIVGSFDSVTLDSVGFTGNQLDVTEGTYILSYSATSVDLAFAPIPEPGTYALLVAALASFVVWRRRS